MRTRIRTLEDVLARALVDESGCWLWARYVDGCGYGGAWFDKKVQPAHRVAYQLAFGPIQDGLQLDHLCRNRACVNPEHLEAVTPFENMIRGLSFAAANWAKRNCPAGHPYDVRNTYRDAKGGRKCRKCNTAAVARYKARRAAISEGVES